MNITRRIPVIVSTLTLLTTLSLSQAVSADNWAPNAKKRFHQIDVNNNGPLDPHELKRARYLHRRIDVNDDGHIGPRERRYAHKVKNHADLNNDGHIGKRERHIVRHTLNDVDRQY